MQKVDTDYESVGTLRTVPLQLVKNLMGTCTHAVWNQSRYQPLTCSSSFTGATSISRSPAEGTSSSLSYFSSQSGGKLYLLLHWQLPFDGKLYAAKRHDGWKHFCFASHQQGKLTRCTSELSSHVVRGQICPQLPNEMAWLPNNLMCDD